MPADVLSEFDFDLLDSPDFKEDSVREEIVRPLLQALGYKAGGLNRIVRSKKLLHPFVQIGSKKQSIHVFPDYMLVVDGKAAWVMDAKGPEEDILSGPNVEQAYSYAIHPDVRVNFYALCNGRALSVFSVEQRDARLYVQLAELEARWEEVDSLLSPAVFNPKADVEPAPESQEEQEFAYTTIKPLLEIHALQKQSAKRHFGVHGYFTKQVWNVVQKYIHTFTRPGDVVLDPFGGSGVTVVEALLLGRKGIHVDINPLSVFITDSLLRPVDFNLLAEEYSKLRKTFAKHAPVSDEEIREALAKYPYPKGVRLPRDSDVDTVDQLFSPAQLARLAYLKWLILRVKNQDVRQTLLLMFSGLLNKVNLTYHASAGRSEGRGDSSVYRYYRYRIAKTPASLDILTYLDSRLKKVVAAKREIALLSSGSKLTNAEIRKGSATNLDWIKNESVDYIYTDPPYGKKIKYLDLSVMWNAWLDLPVTKEDFELEAIEGGEAKKTKAEYAALLAESIREMYRVLKFDRWMSFVFAHSEPAYWHLIVDTAERAGFEYMGAVKQSNDKVSFKKHQNPFTVLSGQLIISFKKVRNPKSVMKVDLGADIADIVFETVEAVIAQHEGATVEQINDELVIKGLELGFLDVLSKQYKDISPLLREHFEFDAKTKKYFIPPNTKFQSRIDVRTRIRYFVLSYLRRMRHQQHEATFDEIVLNIMPLLKNGVTPKHQTIRSVLEEVAEHAGQDAWRLRETGQLNLLPD